MDPNQAQDPSTLMQVNQLIANLGSLGLAIYSDVTQKPIISTPGPGGSVLPVNQVSSSLNTVLIIGLIAVVAFIALGD